jgi:hypothetical protein
MGNLLSLKKQENSTTSEDNISSDHVKQLITTMLQNKDLNLSFVPDSIEEKIYEKIINTILTEVQQLLTTVKVQFLNQEITLHMKPIE